MIFIDCKGDKPEKHPGADMIRHINAMGVHAERSDLQFGDAAFEGKGPDGTVGIGIERKSLHDMLNCIDDARLSGHQKVGMRGMYAVSILMLEGHWKPHDPQGFLMEGFNGGINFGFLKHRKQNTMYSKLYRYLLSVSLSGMFVSYSRDVWHTSYNICECYHYFQKNWDDHTSMREIHQLALPSLVRKPTLVRSWASRLTNVGVKLSERVDRIFKSGWHMANADEQEWLQVPGIGVKSAQEIVREIWGIKK